MGKRPGVEHEDMSHPSYDSDMIGELGDRQRDLKRTIWFHGLGEKALMRTIDWQQASTRVSGRNCAH